MAACLGLCAALVGCSSPYEAAVSGRVTLDGQPLTKGHVAFLPIGDGTVANGTIEMSGAYTLRTATKAGLPPGRYKVTVVATDPPPPNDPEAAGVLLTPRRYGDVRTTPLDVEVQAGSNDIDLALTSMPE